MRLTFSKNKNLKIAALFLFIGLATVPYLSDKFSEKKLKAQRSEITVILETYAAAQLAYFEDYKEFTSDKSKLGFDLGSERVVVYFNKEEIPEGIRAQIKQSSVPYITKNSFRILCLFFMNKKKPEVWTINNSREVFHSGYITIN